VGTVKAMGVTSKVELSLRMVALEAAMSVLAVKEKAEKAVLGLEVDVAGVLMGVWAVAVVVEKRLGMATGLVVAARMELGLVGAVAGLEMEVEVMVEEAVMKEVETSWRNGQIRRATGMQWARKWTNHSPPLRFSPVRL